MDLSNFDPWVLIIVAAVAGVSLLLATAAIVRWFRRQDSEPFASRSDLSIDVGALPAHGPPVGGPQLTFYGMPVRLAVLVLAPVGRERELPPKSQLPPIMEQLCPHLNAILARDEPIFRTWPAQLSSHGFLQSFFHHLALPGERGKNTPWCSVAGKFTAGGAQYLVGLVCCADRANGFSQVVVEHEGRWLEVVRVRLDDNRS